MAAPQAAAAATPRADPAKPKGYIAGKVFATPELLEGILLNLSTRRLFGVQRTCKTFIDTIRGSIKLQRAMFLSVDPSVTYDLENAELNPLLYELAFVPGRELYEAGAHAVTFYEEELDADDDNENEYGDEKDNPEGKSEVLALVFKATSSTKQTGKSTKIHKYRWTGTKKVWVSQSWRRTLVSQGEPAELDVTMWVDDVLRGNFEEPIRSFEWERTSETDNQEASDKSPWIDKRQWADLTLGTVVDRLEEKIREEFREEELLSDESEDDYDYYDENDFE